MNTPKSSNLNIFCSLWSGKSSGHEPNLNEFRNKLVYRLQNNVSCKTFSSLLKICKPISIRFYNVTSITKMYSEFKKNKFLKLILIMYNLIFLIIAFYIASRVLLWRFCVDLEVEIIFIHTFPGQHTSSHEVERYLQIRVTKFESHFVIV